MPNSAEEQIISVSDDVITTDSAPLLPATANRSSGSDLSSPSATRRGRFSNALRLLRRRSSRRLMREPSVLVRQTAAEQLEERQNELAYSRPVVIVDLLWNLSFILVSVVILILTIRERPSNPLRIWVLGYAVQCGVHMACVCMEFRRRHDCRHQTSGRHCSRPESRPDITQSSLPHPDSDASGTDRDDGQTLDEPFPLQIGIAKRAESVNTSFSFIWWVVGFYWTTTGNQSQSAPLLFWLCVAFLAFDVFFVVACVSLVCIIGLAVCCCLPCIIAIMYAVAEQKGASDDDINLLPKYKFQRTGSFTKTDGESVGRSGGVMSIVSTTPGAFAERSVPAEDAECCICLSSYDDGAELRELPCGHHFHCGCIDRWLRMNSTCPLCKYDITRSSSGREDV